MRRVPLFSIRSTVAWSPIDSLAFLLPHHCSRNGRGADQRIAPCADVGSKKGNIVDVILEIRYRRIKVLPPIGKQSRYPALSLTVIHAREREDPGNRKRIEWKLITDLPVTSRREAIEKLDWHALRRKIETFRKILKSGCKAEDSRLRTADRLANQNHQNPDRQRLAVY